MTFVSVEINGVPQHGVNLRDGEHVEISRGDGLIALRLTRVSRGHVKVELAPPPSDKEPTRRERVRMVRV